MENYFNWFQATRISIIFFYCFVELGKWNTIHIDVCIYGVVMTWCAHTSPLGVICKTANRFFRQVISEYFMFLSSVVPSDTWLLFCILLDLIHSSGHLTLQELMLDTIWISWRIFCHVHFNLVDRTRVKFVNCSVLCEVVSWFRILRHKSCMRFI